MTNLNERVYQCNFKTRDNIMTTEPGEFTPARNVRASCPVVNEARLNVVEEA
jgi:hypothetical protein